jgi:hypothetical protein
VTEPVAPASGADHDEHVDAAGDAAADGMATERPRPPVPAPPGGRAWQLASVLAVAWVAFRVVELALVRFDGHAFLRLQDWLDGLPGRLATVVVLVAVLLHATGGLRAVVGVRSPRGAGLAGEPGSAAMWFLTLALAVPGAAILLWPWVDQNL